MDYNKQGFERIYKDNYRQMYRFAFSILEDAEEARDAVSQVFTQMWNSQPAIADASVMGYLLAATRNRCLNIMRQKRLRQQMELEVAMQKAQQENEEREELMEELQRVINDNLTEQDRRVLSLHYDEEMTYEETAKALGISSSAVNKHITRSLGKIRSILKIAR